MARAAANPLSVGTGSTLDQDLNGASDETLRPLERAALDDLDQAPNPLAGLIGRDKTLSDQCGLCVAAWRVDEGVGSVELNLLGEREGLFEIRFALAREADDDVGRQADVGDRLADHRDAGQIAIAVIGAAHRLQNL